MLGEEAPEERLVQELSFRMFVEEPVVLWYAAKTESATHRMPHVSKPTVTYLKVEAGWSSTADGRMPIGLSVENPGPRSEGWGEPGTSDVPDDVEIAARVAMSVLDCDRWDVIVPLAKQLYIYPLVRDEDLENRILKRLDEFWKDNVLPGIEPRFTELDDDVLFARYPAPTKIGEMVKLADLSPGAKETAEAYAQAHVQEKEAKKRKEAAGNNLKAYIGEYSGIDMGAMGTVRWATRKGRTVTNWQTVAHDLLSTMRTGAKKPLPKSIIQKPMEEWASERIENEADQRPLIPSIKGDPELRQWKKAL